MKPRRWMMISSELRSQCFWPGFSVDAFQVYAHTSTPHAYPYVIKVLWKQAWQSNAMQTNQYIQSWQRQWKNSKVKTWVGMAIIWSATSWCARSVNFFFLAFRQRLFMFIPSINFSILFGSLTYSSSAWRRSLRQWSLQYFGYFVCARHVTG